MPVLKSRRQQPAPANPQVPIPNEFPAIPKEVLERFPSAADWQNRLNDFWARTNQALQVAQTQTAAQVNSQVVWTVDRFLVYTNGGGAVPMFALDDTGVRLGNVLVVNTPGRKVYIGVGELANNNTPFYIDTLGNFSLGANLAWDPATSTLTVTGTITATSGSIGGFNIGADYIRDVANSMGLASTITGGDDVRFWAGATFANRATAPFFVKESGDITANNATIIGTISGRSTATVAATINVAGNVITDLINARLDTSAKTMLSDFSFGAADYSGALKAGTITWNTTTGAIAGGSGVLVYRGGIVGAAAGVATFIIDAATGAATFAGALSAPTGNIGGFTLGSDYIRDVANSMGLASTVSGADDVRFWAGATFANRATAPFRVTEAGALVATSATISGTITATTGSIGGFDVGSDYIRDSINSFGLASTVTGGDDVRFWAGDTFANRATAPFRITEAGILVAAGNAYFGNLVLKTNQLNEIATNALASVLINFDGYNGGTTQFRDTYIYDGKNAQVARFDGTSKALTVIGAIAGGSFSSAGSLSASNFSGSSSGTNTGDQTLPTRASLGLATTDNVVFLTVDVGTGGYKVSGTKVVGAQAAAEADVALGTALAGGDTIDKTGVEVNFTDLNTKINSLLGKLRTHGLIAT